MPFTKESAKKHKKGLSDKQSEQWAAIANSVLSKCIKDGGTDETCAPSAIRQANGVVGNQLYVNTANTDYEIREVIHQGRKHIVVPVVMMVEGVHHGSYGPLLHTADELGKYPDSWNGMPIVIHHPLDAEGLPISANSPEIIDSELVGKVYHSRMVDTKLMAEAYLDEQKLSEISPMALAAVMNGEPLEVSIGVFTDEDKVPGTWHNEQYNAVAINHRPDHLALLPGGTGACSWEDGCGIRVNQKKKGGNNKMQVNDKDSLFKMMKTLNEEGFTVSNIGVNADGYMVIMDQIRRALSSLDTKDSYYYLEEVYDDYIIFCKRSQEGGEKLYKQTYKIVEDQVQLTGNPISVIKTIDVAYITNTIKRTKFNNNSKGGNKMEKKEDCGQCMEKIVAIIKNNAAGMTETDREWLLTQEEATLDKLLSKKPVEKIVEKTIEVNAKLTSEQVLNAMSVEDKAALAFGRRQLAEKRANMIKGIQDNTSKELWPDTILNTLSEDMLDKLYASVKKEDEDTVNYSLNGNLRYIDVNAGEEEALFPVGVEIETKK
jgi:hypothetical protein